MDALDQAISDHNPDHVIALVSGGHDSVAMLHYVLDRIDFVCHINTGIGIPQTREHVKSVCTEWGVELKTYAAFENTNKDGLPDPQVYEDIVRKYGFPGPGSHRFMYARLKERPLRVMMREHPGVKLLVTGVRSAESQRRMGNVKPIQVESKNRIWVAPCHDWTSDDQAEYMDAHRIPKNPVKECLGMSGECLCGAFAKPGELDRIRQHFPDVADRIEQIENQVINVDRHFGWGWEDKPPASYPGPFDPLSEVDRVLCTGCEANM